MLILQVWACNRCPEVRFFKHLETERAFNARITEVGRKCVCGEGLLRWQGNTEVLLYDLKARLMERPKVGL